jgi:hypothetical protein
MTEAEAIHLVRRHFESLFLKTCGALASCACGSTLALTTDGMALPSRLASLDWLKAETHRPGVSSSVLVETMRYRLIPAVEWARGREPEWLQQVVQCRVLRQLLRGTRGVDTGVASPGSRSWRLQMAFFLTGLRQEIVR